jgi:tyrosine-protein phosphatase YwqE
MIDLHSHILPGIEDGARSLEDSLEITRAAVADGKRPQRTARRLVEDGLAHLLASDAHHASIRDVGMSSAARAIGGPLADWLTHGVPAAILDDTPLPPRPESGRSRGWLGKLLGT